jgi:hypothetical protein
MTRHSNHSQDKYIIAGTAIFLVLIGLLVVIFSRNTDTNKITTTATTSTTFSTTTDLSSTTTTLSLDPLPGDTKEVTLAKCLAREKITMYGAVWCSHCQDQKKAFGEAWKYVPYVECPQNIQSCISKGVESYPTWMKPDGEKIDGFTELKRLADWAGCKY